MKKNYELVLIMGARSSESDRNTTVSSVEKLFPDAIRVKDDIGVIDTSHLLQGNKELNKVYIISYHLELEPSDVLRIKQDMESIVGIVRHFFYVMDHATDFVLYKDAQKQTEELLVKKVDVLRKKNDILAHGASKKHLTRKASNLLKAFITRFDEIKPRKFSTHSVKTQKQLRKHIIRAREIGVVPYVKK